MTTLTYLQGYPESLLTQVQTLITQNRLGEVLLKRYPDTHDITTDKALYTQVTSRCRMVVLKQSIPTINLGLLAPATRSILGICLYTGF